MTFYEETDENYHYMIFAPEDVWIMKDWDGNVVGYRVRIKRKAENSNPSDVSRPSG